MPMGSTTNSTKCRQHSGGRTVYRGHRRWLRNGVRTRDEMLPDVGSHCTRGYRPRLQFATNRSVCNGIYGMTSNSIEEIRVNVVGSRSGYTGMSTTVDRYARALESIGASIRMIDPCKDAPATRPSAGNSEINLLCSEVASYFFERSRLGDDFFRNRYNIGVWLWESPNFPAEW